LVAAAVGLLAMTAIAAIAWLGVALLWFILQEGPAGPLDGASLQPGNLPLSGVPAPDIGRGTSDGSEEVWE
jgi:hypothetical protein